MYNSDNRPIKSKGKYDLNFIDWDNEWAAVYNNGYRPELGKNCTFSFAKHFRAERKPHSRHVMGDLRIHHGKRAKYASNPSSSGSSSTRSR